MSKPQEVEATPDDAFDLGYISGYDAALREVTHIRDPLMEAIRNGDLDRVARLTEEFWVGM